MLHLRLLEVAKPLSSSRRPLVLTRPRSSSSSDATTQILDAYWTSRGVWDVETRGRLVSLGLATPSNDDGEQETVTMAIQQLPGLPTTWHIEGMGRSEVVEASRRLLRLNELLGGSCDVTGMVTREPDLLTADFNLIIARLLQMKSMSAASGGINVNVLDIVAKQPSMLLNNQDWDSLQKQQEASSSSSSSFSFSSSSQEDEGGELLRSWKAGVLSDSDPEWVARYQELQEYRSTAGDTHVGFWRDIDSPSLSRWAAKQRSDFKQGEMTGHRKVLLDEIGFEWEDSEAEFMRWFSELKSFRDRNGHTNLNTLSAGDDLYLYNWCAIQRIALRCRVLSEKRKGLLDDLGFDWTGADPLS